jgi:hypothetical protein
MKLFQDYMANFSPFSSKRDESSALAETIKSQNGAVPLL